MWYNVSKEVSKLSFGMYSALNEIEMVQKMSRRNPNMQYYYLQGWNRNNKKLSYKANYEPKDFYCPCIVQDWVPTLEGVDEAKAKTKALKELHVQGKSKPQATNQKEPENDKNEELKSDAKLSSEEGKEPMESTNGDGRAVESKVTSCRANLVEVEEDDKPSVACCTYPNDLERYKNAMDRSSIDLNKIVICLNHSEYIHLSELFECASMDDAQRKIMEERLSELVVALGPELCSQLVIDLKACGTA